VKFVISLFIRIITAEFEQCCYKHCLQQLSDTIFNLNRSKSVITVPSYHSRSHTSYMRDLHLENHFQRILSIWRKINLQWKYRQLSSYGHIHNFLFHCILPYLVGKCALRYQGTHRKTSYLILHWKGIKVFEVQICIKIIRCSIYVLHRFWTQSN
jgi:hypothetical protein